MTQNPRHSPSDSFANCIVSIIAARDADDTVRAAWTDLRARNPALWSPYFDIRLFGVLAQVAPNAKLAIVRRDREIVALLPFQGKKGGLARPLGAPLSDQHALIQAHDSNIQLGDVVEGMDISGFAFSGLRDQVHGALKLEMSMCHVADLSAGIENYVEWRKTNWKEQVKKNDRRKRQGEREWGAMRIETACPKTSNYFETLMALKQAKFLETNRHNVLSVPWIQTFLRTLYESSDPDFAGEITLLYFGEHLAAMEFGLRAGTAMHSWFPVFDRAYAQVSPGILLMDGMIEACALRGITKVDLGIGHDQYKRHASNAPFPMWSGTLPVTPMRQIASKLFMSTDDWLKKTLKGEHAEILTKIERRSEIILAAEPTFWGRVRGFATALKVMS